MDVAVGLVKSYLELCGYFVLTELPVRVASGDSYRSLTDLDVVGVRFPSQPLVLPRRIARPLEVLLDVDLALGAREDAVDVIVGEVKEGPARLNPALRRAETVAFALRRVGCCPEEQVEEEARLIARMGEREFAMPGRTRCRVRLVAFAGHGVAAERGVHTVGLGYCADFIAERLREASDVLAGAQFKDPVLALFALQGKLARRETPPPAAQDLKGGLHEA